jgi:epoxyqueuosine reductase
MSLSEDVKDFGLDLGYSKVGITTAESFPEYTAELNGRRDMYAWYADGTVQPLKGAEPKSCMPAAKSIIVLVNDIFKQAFPESLIGKVGRHYLSRANLTARHRINGARRQLMREFLEKNGVNVAQRVVVPDRMAAARAGACTYGKNTFAFGDDMGSFIIITSFLVDVELDYDKPTLETKCPPKCTACIDACPTGALYEPLKMNPLRCIAFNTFMTQDNYVPGINSYILPDIREKMGTWIHGCDICQEVCPRNQKRLKAKLPQDEYLAKVASDFDFINLLTMPGEFFAKRVLMLMPNYIREKKYFQRNAAIAMGNSGDTSYIPHLAKAMQDSEEIVRGYAAWALGKMGGQKAKQALDSSLPRETSQFAKKEIAAALASLRLN